MTIETHCAIAAVCALAPVRVLLDLKVAIIWMADLPRSVRITTQVNSLSDKDWTATIIGTITIANSATVE